MVDENRVIWAQALPKDTSTQRVELVILPKALELRKRLNTYKNRYAFATVHQQRGLLTSEGKEVKNKKEILALLRVLHDPARPRKGLWYTSTGKKILPHKQTEAMIKQMHQWTHLGVNKLIQMFSETKYYVTGLKYLVEQIVHWCVPC